MGTWHIITAAFGVLLLASTGCVSDTPSPSGVHSVPPFSDAVDFHADPTINNSPDQIIDKTALRHICETYFVVSEERWLNHYSHLGLLDQTGTSDTDYARTVNGQEFSGTEKVYCAVGRLRPAGASLIAPEILF